MPQTIIELETPLWVATPKGDCLARYLIFTGLDQDLLFICEAEKNGTFWMFRGPEVRTQRNFTRGFGRPFPVPVKRRPFDPATAADPERP